MSVDDVFSAAIGWAVHLLDTQWWASWVFVAGFLVVFLWWEGRA